MPHPDRTIYKPHDPGPGGRGTIRIKHAVHTEIAVMLPLPVITAIGISAVRVTYRMINHLPHTAAHQIVVCIDFLPIPFRVSRSYPHGVRIFTEEIGPVAQFPYPVSLLTDGMHPLDRRIHLAPHIVGLFLRVNRTLIVHRQVRMLFQIVIHPVRIINAARLIPQAPQNHRHVSLVTLVQPSRPVHVMPRPRRIVADAVIIRRKSVRHGTVRLQVRLIYHIDAQFVAQLQQIRIRRIVGRAHRINIIFLTELHIPLDLFRRQRITVVTARIVVIDAVQLHFTVIQIKNGAPDRHILKARPYLHTAAGHFIVQIVQHRRLRIPFLYRQILEYRFGHPVFRLHRPAFKNTVSFQNKSHFPVRIQLHAGRRPIALRCLTCLKTDIPDVPFLADPQQHIPKDAVIAEHILTLQIGAVTPAAHHRHQFIGPRMDIRSNIELRRIVGTFRIARKAAVHIQIDTACHPEEGQHMVFRTVLHLKKPAVHTHIIVLFLRLLPPRPDPMIRTDPAKALPHLLRGRNLRRLVWELVTHIHIERLRIPAKLPAGRHIQPVKLHIIRVDHFRKLTRPRIKLKVPLAVQADDLRRAVTLPGPAHSVRLLPVRIRDKITSRRKFVDLKCVKILVVRCVDPVLHTSAS